MSGMSPVLVPVVPVELLSGLPVDEVEEVEDVDEVDEVDDPPPVSAGDTDVTPGPLDENPTAGSPPQATARTTTGARRRMALTLALYPSDVMRGAVSTCVWQGQLPSTRMAASSSPPRCARESCFRDSWSDGSFKTTDDPVDEPTTRTPYVRPRVSGAADDQGDGYGFTASPHHARRTRPRAA